MRSRLVPTVGRLSDFSGIPIPSLAGTAQVTAASLAAPGRRERLAGFLHDLSITLDTETTSYSVTPW
jgi:hypothetical protein